MAARVEAEWGEEAGETGWVKAMLRSAMLGETMDAACAVDLAVSKQEVMRYWARFMLIGVPVMVT